MLLIAIDGACRRNGQPDCVSSGGVFIQDFAEDGTVTRSGVISCFEANSTNQRGELKALIQALYHVYATQEPAQILTDSEYLFNAMTKEWPQRWAANGWITANGGPVANADLWQRVMQLEPRITSEVNYYHIKGHVIPFGKVTAEKSLQYDPTGKDLAKQVTDQLRRFAPRKADVIEHAQELSEKNNGFRFSDEILKRFVVANVVADAIATGAVEAADRKI